MVAPSRLFICITLLVFGPGAVRASATEEPSLETKVGQLFIIGIQQKSVDGKVRKLIEDIRPGGLILFRRNLGDISAVRSLTASLRESIRGASGLSPFLAVDQEGGSVVRIPVFPSLPAPAAIGKAGDDSLARDLGEETGKILRWCGFNMNLAPVLDLSDPLKVSFIGNRSFGPDPSLSGRLGKAFAEGLGAAGILPTAKHFPGLGAVIVDPHDQVSSNSSDGDRLLKDLQPFQDYVALGDYTAVMVSQLSYPALDESGQPAPFSRKILFDLLRERLGYRGLVVTDDLQMKGTSALLSPSEAALRSLQAGADIVMITWSAEEQRRAVSRVIAAVRSGEWPRSELDARFERIRRMKAHLESFPPSEIKIGRGPRGEPATKTLERIDLRLLDESLNKHAFGFPEGGRGKTCVVSAQNAFLNSYRQGKKKSSATRFVAIKGGDTPTDLARRISDCARIVFAVNGRKTAKLLAGLPQRLRKKTLLVNFSLPATVPAKVVEHRVEIGHPHVHAGFRIAQILEGRRPASTSKHPN